jgi:hypothetical protein
MTIINNHDDKAESEVAPFGGSMSRGQFFGALLILSCVNGVASRAIAIAADRGWLECILSTCGVSLIVWLALVAGISLLLRGSEGPISRFDISVGVIGLFLIWLPIGGTSWLATTALSLYLILTEEVGSGVRRGAFILLAVSAPMFLESYVFYGFFRHNLTDRRIYGRLAARNRQFWKLGGLC